MFEIKYRGTWLQFIFQKILIEAAPYFDEIKYFYLIEGMRNEEKTRKKKVVLILDVVVYVYTLSGSMS